VISGAAARLSFLTLREHLPIGRWKVQTKSGVREVEMCRLRDGFRPLFGVLAFWPLLIGCSEDKPKPTTPVNDPPTACFAIAPAVGTTETPFSFDASCSSDRQDDTESLLVR
jgi:hypothetical protein